jgi:hypothetical protein
MRVSARMCGRVLIFVDPELVIKMESDNFGVDPFPERGWRKCVRVEHTVAR